MFLKVFLGVLLCVIPASAQLRRPAPDTVKKSPVIVALSHDGQMLAVARSKERAARVELFSTATGELHRTISGFDGPIWSITFSGDGKSVITVSSDIRDDKIQTSVKDRSQRKKVAAELRWWDAHSGQFIRKVPLADERVVTLQAAWSPSGDVMALVERYSETRIAPLTERGAFQPRVVLTTWIRVEELELKLLDAHTGQRRLKMEDAEKSYEGRLAFLYGRMDLPVFSPDGKLLAAVSGQDVVVWNVGSGKKVLTVKKLFGAPMAITFSPDSSVVAIASVKKKDPGAESEIALWNVSTGKSVTTLKGKSDFVACLRYIAEGRFLLIGSLQYGPEGMTGTMKVWDPRDNRLRVIEVHDDEMVSSLNMLPDESAVVVQSADNVELRETKTGKVIHTFASDEEDSESMRRSRYVLSAKRALAVAFSRDGTTVSAEIPGEGVRRWDARTGGVKEKIELEQGSDTAIAISSDGDFLVEATANGVRLTNLVKGTADVIVPATGPISALALSPDGKMLAVSSDDEIELWKVGDKTAATTINAGQKITAVAIDASGTLVAAAREDRSIGLWDLKTGVLQAELRKHEEVVNALAFSPDGKILASGGDDRTAILWDVQSRKSKRTLKGHDLTVTSLAFSPDGRLLASGSGNAAVVLWTVESGKLERILR